MQNAGIISGYARVLHFAANQKMKHVVIFDDHALSILRLRGNAFFR